MVKGEQVTVDDTRDVVADARKATTNLLTNRDATDSVYLGDVTVTAPAGGAPGYELPAGASIGVELGGKDKLYAVCAAGLSARIDALRT